MNKYLIRCNSKTGYYEYLSQARWKPLEVSLGLALSWPYLGSETTDETSYTYHYGPIKPPMKHCRDF